MTIVDIFMIFWGCPRRFVEVEIKGLVSAVNNSISLCESVNFKKRAGFQVFQVYSVFYIH